MWKWFLILAVLSTPLSAERETNFGRVILDQCDLIVQGVASAMRTQVRGAHRVEISIETVLYGEEAATDVSMFYTDPESIGADATRALFALKRLADGGYNLVGKPVLTPLGDAEEDDKVRVCRDFVKLEKLAEGDERTTEFWTLLSEHIRLGGYPAQNAAVELMFIARDRGSTVTQERFDAVVAARDAALSRLTKATQADLKLGFQGLVEARIKKLKFKTVRRGETNKEKRDAARELNDLQIAYPRAFTEEDAKLCDALIKVAKDTLLEDKLLELARNVRADVRERESDERRKEADARRKIEHAGK